MWGCFILENINRIKEDRMYLGEFFCKEFLDICKGWSMKSKNNRGRDLDFLVLFICICLKCLSNMLLG